MFSLWGFLFYIFTPKDGSRPYKMKVWSLLKNNLTWEDAKKERKRIRGSEIVPRVFDVKPPEPEAAA